MKNHQTSTSEKALQILKQNFGYDRFRQGQAEIIDSIMKGRDTVAIRSTGSGKSICFQVPALSFSGLTLVISPLISLMTDQVEALQQHRIRAAYINSSLNSAQKLDIQHKLKQNHYKLLYLSPEKLNSNRFARFLQKLPIKFIAVDEAHCISMWGHDFRPSYKNIPDFVAKLPTRPVIAGFTATATARIQRDIVQLLRLHQPTIFKQSAMRTNLALNIIPCASKAEKQLSLLKLLKKHHHQTGIIYCSTRKSTQKISSLINQLNFRQQLTSRAAAAYHGGLESDERTQIQTAFLNNQTQVICATNAFGMGVDKSNIRFVIHYQVPANLENYYQEVGRAGRDGADSDCYLLLNQADIMIQYGLLQNTSKQRYPIELQKLQTIIKTLTQDLCLQQQLAYYFDDQQETNCGQCGVCQNFKIQLNRQEKQYLGTVQQYPVLSQLPTQTQYILSLLQPQTKQEWLKIPGIGLGIAEQLKQNRVKFSLEKSLAGNFKTLNNLQFLQ